MRACCDALQRTATAAPGRGCSPAELTVVAVDAGVLANVMESRPVADNHPASGTYQFVLDLGTGQVSSTPS